MNSVSQDRAESNYSRSALVGAALALALRRGKLSRGKAAAIGAGGGIAAQALTRSATATSMDSFGERSYDAKRVEKLPWQIGGAAAAAADYPSAGISRDAPKTPVKRTDSETRSARLQAGKG